MPLDRQNISVSFSGGLDTKTDSKQVVPGNFLVLQNAIKKSVKQLLKRNGYAGKPKSVVGTPSLSFSAVPGTIASGKLLSNYQDELVMGDGMNFYSYDPSNAGWKFKGRSELCQVSSNAISKTETDNILADSAYNASLAQKLFAWEVYTQHPILNADGTIANAAVYNGISVSLLDQATSQKITSPVITSTLPNTASRPKCVAIGSNLYVIYYSSVTGITAAPVTIAGVGSPIVLAADINATNPNFDVLVFNSLVYVAYNGNAANIKVKSFNAALTNIATNSQAEMATNCIGIFTDASNNAWVCYSNGAATKAFILNSTLAAAVLAPTIVDNAQTNITNITGIHDGTRGIIFFDQQNNPRVGSLVDTTNGPAYTQPAVGSTVMISLVGTAGLTLVGQIAYVQGGGYYYVQGIFPTAILAVNLGYPGNAAPTTAVATGTGVFGVGGRSNAITFYNTLTSGGSVGSTLTFTRSAGLNSRAFLLNGFAHVVLSHEDSLQPTYFTGALYDVDINAATPNAFFSAKIGQSVGAGMPIKPSLPAVNNITGQQYGIALSEQVIDLSVTVVNVEHLIVLSGVNEVGLDFTGTQLTTKENANNLHIGSGTLLMYDGNSVVEHGFHLYPENATVTRSAGTGDLGAGLYGYKFVYSWVDGQGQIHRSAPSPNVSITNTASDSNTLVVPTLRITNKTNVTIEAYRTVVNGATYFRLDTQYTFANVPPVFPFSNNTTADSFTFIDGNQDSDITGNQQLYTTGEVENISAPASSYVSIYRQRLTTIPSEYPFSFQYSKQVEPNVPVEFNDAFVDNIQTNGGPIIGMIEMDDKNILLKGSNLYYMVGTGPSSSGTGNDFSDAFLIATDVGVVDIKSIVLMPLGVMFKSSKGIYLLDRSLQAQYVGAGVESYNSNHVLAATLISNVNQVRFVLDSGVALVYDYFINQWSVFTNHPAVDACIFQGNYTYLNSDGLVLSETPGVYSDNGSYISMGLTTSWIQLGDLQGFQRAYQGLLLGDYISPHNLVVSVFLDFSTSPIQTDIIPPTAMGSNLYQWRINYAQQKCQSVQLQISDQQDASLDVGEGMRLSGFAMEIGVKKGLKKIGAANAFG